MDQSDWSGNVNKSNACSGLTPLNPCAAWLIVIFAAVLLVAGFVLGDRLCIQALLATAVVAMGVTALLEVIRHYWTDRYGPSTPVGTVRVLALWFGCWVLMYTVSAFPVMSVPNSDFFNLLCKTSSQTPVAVPRCSSCDTPDPLQPQQTQPSDASIKSSGGSDDGISLVTAVLGFVLAVTTLVATKVAADAKGEVQAVHEELKKSKDIAFLAESASFDLNLQRLLAWRVEIMLTMGAFQDDQPASARLDGLGKIITKLKVPMEETLRWGTSELNHSALEKLAQDASSTLLGTVDLSATVKDLLGHSEGENHLRELGMALGRFLEHLRSRHPHATISELEAWEALARLSQVLKKL
jgi:hypothetical protein